MSERFEEIFYLSGMPYAARDERGQVVQLAPDLVRSILAESAEYTETDIIEPQLS